MKEFAVSATMCGIKHNSTNEVRRQKTSGNGPQKNLFWNASEENDKKRSILVLHILLYTHSGRRLIVSVREANQEANATNEKKDNCDP